jgi:hypothetical protein
VIGNFSFEPRVAEHFFSISDTSYNLYGNKTSKCGSNFSILCFKNNFSASYFPLQDLQ